MLIKGTNQEQTSFQRTRAAPTINNQLPGTFWVNHLPSVLKHSMIALHNIPSDQMTDMTEAFERMQRFFFFFFPGDPRHHPSHSDCAPDSVIYSKRPLVDGTVLVAKLSDLTPSCERGSLKKKTKQKTKLCCSFRVVIVCMGGERFFTTGSENVSIWYSGPSCLLFSMFQLAKSLLGLCNLTPAEKSRWCGPIQF